MLFGLTPAVGLRLGVSAPPPPANAPALTNWALDNSGAPSLTIATTRNTGVTDPQNITVAPAPVWFDAIPASFGIGPKATSAIAHDPAFHEIEYLWDFGDPGDTFTAPQNVLPQHLDANSATGQQACHVFRQHGTYTVTCTARRIVSLALGTIEEATATTQIVVADPATFWNAANTIVVTHDSDFTGAPAADFQATAWTSANNFWNDATNWYGILRKLATSGPATNVPVRVLFKRGGDYSSVSNPLSMVWSNAEPHKYSHVHFGAWGSGAKPITQRCVATAIVGRSMSWDSIHFKSNYDDVTQTGTNHTLMDISGAGTILLTNCDFSSGGTGISIIGHSPDTRSLQVFHDCTFSSLGSYGITNTLTRAADLADITQRDRLAIIGCRDVDTGNAPHWGGGGSGVGNSQGPIRLNGMEYAIVSNCDFYARYGWTGANTWPLDGVNGTAEQACMRLLSAGMLDASTPCGNVVVSRCSGEGGEFFSNVSLSVNYPPQGNCLIEQCVYVASPQNSTFGRMSSGPATVRSNLFVKPDVTGSYVMTALLRPQLFSHRAETNVAARKAEPIAIYGNSFIMLGQTTLADGALATMASDFDTTVDANNAIYTPANAALPDHENIAPIDSTALWAPRYLGRLEVGDSGVLNTALATPVGAPSLYQPETGSVLVQDATAGQVSLYDVTGAIRDAAPSRGAVEPEYTRP